VAWTDNDLKIFAAGLAIGGKYNHTHGTLPRVKSSMPSGRYSDVFYVTLSCDLAGATIMYSIDGSTPTTVYAGEQIYVGGDLVIFAFAMYGQGLSPMSKYTYDIYVPAIFADDNVGPVPTLIDSSCIVAITTDLKINVSDGIAVPGVADSDITSIILS
jgi:hypothetical protein